MFIEVIDNENNQFNKHSVSETILQNIQIHKKKSICMEWKQNGDTFNNTRETSKGDNLHWKQATKM